MAILARLGVVLGLDTAEFQQGLASANKKLSEFADKIPTLGKAGAAAFAAMTYEAMQFADTLSDTAAANDVTITSILRLQEALMMSGGEAENAGKMMASFTKFVDEAAGGSDSAQKALAKVGVSLKDIANKDNWQLFQQVAENLSGIDDVVTRNAKAMEILGKAAKGVDFTQFNDNLKEGASLSAEYEKAINDAADAWDLLNKAHHEFMANFTAGIGTPLKLSIEYMQSLTKETNLFGQIAKTVFETVAVVGSNVAFVVRGIASEVSNIYATSKILFTEGLDAAKRLNEQHDQYWQNERAKLDEFQRRVMGGGGGYGGGTSNFDDPRRLDKPKATSTGPKRTVELGAEAKKLQQQLEVMKLISLEYQRHLDFQFEQLQIEGRMADMTDNERKIQEAINKVTDDTNKKLDEIQKKREEVAAHGGDKKVLAEIDKQAAAVKALGETYKEKTKTEIEAQVAHQRTFEFGWKKAFEQYKENAFNNAKMAEEMFSSVTDSMGNALDQFVKTGKLNFKSLAYSIIQDLIMIQARYQMMQMFSTSGLPDMLKSGLSNFATAGSGIGSWLSSLFGTGKAGGGNINGPTLVGENGPELFIPSGQGTVIPNQQMSNAMSGGPSVVYNGPYIASMSAIDTQSAAQFLAKNKSAVWAANQSAQRSLPVSR